MKKLFSLFLTVFVFALSASAEVADPVKWTMDVKADSPQSGTITWTAVIEKGYHIYGFQQIADGPIATTIKPAPVEGLTLVGNITPSEEAASHFDPMFSLNISE